MEPLLGAVIALSCILGIVILVSVLSILFVQSKYTTIKDSQKEDEEAQERAQKSTNTAPYIPHSVYSAKIPKVDDLYAYQRLEEILMRDPVGTTQMTEAFHPHAMDEVAQALVVLFEANDQVDVLIRHFIDLEMTKANEGEGAATLFRRDSVASKVMRFYTKLIGQQYLISVLWPNIRYVCLSDEMIEIDRNKMKKEDDLEEHLTKFQDILANFLEAIVNSVPLCPPQLRAICHHLNTKADQFFPDNNLKVVSGFIFLRFFTPAIICPTAYGIVEGDLTPNQSRTLLLVAKVMQNMANGVFFGAKEQFMMPLNEFLTANTSLVKGFLSDLAQPDPSIPSIKAFGVSTDSKLNALRVLHANLVRSFPKFKRENYPFLYDKTQMLIKDLSDESKRASRGPMMHSSRRVSVSLLRADSGQYPPASTSNSSTTPPAKSVSLQSINISTTPPPLSNATYSNLQPINTELDIPSEPRKREGHENQERAENQENEEEDGEDVESDGDEDEEEEYEGEQEGMNENAEQGELVHSSASLIPPNNSTSSPSSPVPLLTKSKSGASLTKSKSGNPAKKKKKKHPNIPNERLYRPSSASSKSSTTPPVMSSTASFSTTAASTPSASIRPSSSMKTAVRTTPSPKLPRSYSPSPSRPAALGDVVQPASKMSKISSQSPAAPPK